MTTDTLTTLLQEGIRHHERGALEAAGDCYRRALELQADHPRALYLLANLALQQGHHEEAVNLLARALEQAPGNIACLFNQGLALRALGRLDEAIARFRQVIEQRPQEANAWCNLGEALHAKGNPGEAMTAYERALALDAHLPAALMNLGNAKLETGQHGAAAALYRRLLERQPAHAGAWLNLGEALRRQGRLAAACEAYRKALALQPQHIDAWHCLAEICVQLERLDEAAAAFRKALALDASRLDLWLRLGQTEELRGRTDETLAAYGRALEIDPGHAQAHYLRGNTLSHLGRFTEAAAAFHRALELDPRHTVVYYALSQIRGYRFSSAEREAMTALYEDDSTPDDQREFLGFALGRAAEQAGEYERAFGYFAAGNRLVRRHSPYDSADMEAFFEEIITTFDRDFFRQRQDFGVADETPIFIVGMMRSGTSLVEQILASHPQVQGAGELTDLKRIIYYFDGDLDPQAYPAHATALDAGQVQARAREYLSCLARHGAGARHVSDKMPGNFRYLGMIRLMFPRARIIHCRRHPLDTCLSCFRLYFSGAHPYAYDLRELGHYYRLYERLMRHWHAVLPGYIHDIRYEDLVADQERETRRLLAFCGLPWDPACLDFHKTRRAVLTSSQAQVREPIYRSSVAGWKAYEPHLAPLIEALGDALPAGEAPAPGGDDKRDAQQ